MNKVGNIPCDITVRPLFYDALSGEFLPPSDPLQRAHTLGRLSYAACSKGTRSPDARPWISKFLYTPSWAEHVRVIADCHSTGTNNQEHFLGAITLVSVAGTQLEIADLEGDGIYIAENGNETELEVQLGTELSIARQAVTCAAQRFFEAPLS